MLRIPTRVRRGSLVAAVAGLWLVGCGGGSTTVGDGGADGGGGDAVSAADAGPDAPMTRSFALAATGAQIDLQDGLGLYPANLATDTDVIAIHQEFYGLPWNEIMAGGPLPPEWLAKMDELAGFAHATGKPVFLSLGLVGGAGGRSRLADEVVIADGRITTQPASGACYDFATASDGAERRAAYVGYVQWMMEEFDPTWINVATEVNMFQDSCPDAWPAMVDTERAAYEAAKAAKPGVIAFPSIQLSFLYGEEGCPSGDAARCYDDNYAGLSGLERDRFAISVYPDGESYASADALPSGYLTRGADRGGERMVVAETGWLATDATGVWADGSCLTALHSDPATQLGWFDRVTADAQAAGSDLVTWWSDRDLIPAALMTDCPCTFDAQWCAVKDAFRSLGGTDPTAQFYGEMSLKIFGTMGLRTHDGTLRPGFRAHWQAWRDRPIAAP
jgi:hypothetical protein